MAEAADQFVARLTWHGREPLLPERSYRMRYRGAELEVRITAIKHRVDPESSQRLAARSLARGESGVVTIWTGTALALDPSAAGSPYRFVVVAPGSDDALADGEIDFALRRATNVRWQPLAVDKAARAGIKGQQPCCVWLTGLPGAGKSTIANRLEQRLLVLGHHSYLLDGDNVRHGLNRDLGFTDADRVENIRRVIEVARLMVDAGLIVITSFISPFRAERDQARSAFGAGEFVEVFVDTPLAVCEARDPKGLYARARRGELPHFTGIDSAYEPPLAPDAHLHPAEEPVDACVDRLLDTLERRLPRAAPTKVSRNASE